MPTWPTPPGRQAITIELPIHLVQHLDAQAAHYSCSRAAYLRRLITSDRDLHSPLAANG